MLREEACLMDSWKVAGIACAESAKRADSLRVCRCCEVLRVEA